MIDLTERFDLPDGTQPESLVPSPGAASVAYAVADESGMHVEVNRRAMPTYEQVFGITFSPDSQRVGFVAHHRGRTFLVVGEKEYPAYDNIGITSPVFSPDSQHVAYAACRNNRWFAVRDEEILGGPYEGFSPGGIIFSPDSRKIAYAVKRGDVWAVVVNGAERADYPTLIERSLVFSPDSTKLAYVAFHSRKRRSLLERLRSPLSPDVWNVGVVVGGEWQRLWVHDESSGKNGLSNEIYFSPDSNRLAYHVKQDGEWFFVVDGLPQQTHEGLVSGWQPPAWNKFPGYGKTMTRSNCVSFSPDSRHVAYAVASRGRHALVYDGEERAAHEKITNNPISFSRDSRHLAYTAEEQSEQFVVLDGLPRRRFYGIAGDRGFSPDSARFAYLAMPRPKEYAIVVNEETWPVHGGPMIGANLVWDDSQTLHTLLGRERTVIVARLDLD
jgi:hypothetical protein